MMGTMMCSVCAVLCNAVQYCSQARTLAELRSNVREQSMQVKLEAEQLLKWFCSLGCKGGVIGNAGAVEACNARQRVG